MPKAWELYRWKECQDRRRTSCWQTEGADRITPINGSNKNYAKNRSSHLADNWEEETWTFVKSCLFPANSKQSDL